MSAKPDPAPFEARLRELLPADMSWRVVLNSRRTKHPVAARVLPGGAVVFSVHPDADPDMVAQFVSRNRQWLTKAVAGQRTNTPRPPLRLVDGEELLVLGRPVRLRLVDGGATVARHVGDELLLRADASRDTLIDWYRWWGQLWMQRQAPAWAEKLKLANLPTFEVADLGPRVWGKYLTGPHTVQMHWWHFQTPEHLAEYTLVHELAHAKAPPVYGRDSRHGRIWQLLMTSVLPGWRRLDAALDAGGLNGLWLGDMADHAADPGRLTLADLLARTTPNGD